jgi:hypothetical protein
MTMPVVLQAMERRWMERSGSEIGLEQIDRLER